jgi:hypothetical protein
MIFWWSVLGSISITSGAEKILLANSRRVSYGNLTVTLYVEEMLPLNLG